MQRARYYISLANPQASSKYGREAHIRQIKRDLKWAFEEEDWGAVRDLAAKLLRFEPQKEFYQPRLVRHRASRGSRQR